MPEVQFSFNIDLNITVSGMRFGLVQSKVGIVSLLSKLKFNRCTKTSMPVKFDKKALALGSDHGHWATVSPRN